MQPPIVVAASAVVVGKAEAPQWAAFCSACGSGIAVGSNFCGRCGAVAQTGQAPAPVVQPVANPGAFGPQTFQMKIGVGDKTPQQIPPELQNMGVQPQRWEKWVQDIENGKRHSVFYGCPLCEGCYWCFPLLCFQALLCMLNPCTWWIMMKDKAGYNETKRAINADLENARRAGDGSLGDLQYEWKEELDGPRGVWKRG